MHLMLLGSSMTETQCSSSTVFAGSIFLSSQYCFTGEELLAEVFEPHSKAGFYFKTPFAVSLSADVFSSTDSDRNLFRGLETLVSLGVCCYKFLTSWCGLQLRPQTEVHLHHSLELWKKALFQSAHTQACFILPAVLLGKRCNYP